VFRVEDAPFPLLPRREGKKLCCHLTVEFLCTFFTQCLDVAASVSEVACLGKGDGFCEFEVKLQPVDTYTVLLDDDDIEVLKRVWKSEPVEGEQKNRIAVLRTYGLVGDGNRLTELGKTMLIYLGYTWGGRKSERIGSPPWEKPIEQIVGTAKRAPREGIAASAQAEFDKESIKKIVDLTSD
jgi:hypothetical protein